MNQYAWRESNPPKSTKGAKINLNIGLYFCFLKASLPSILTYNGASFLQNTQHYFEPKKERPIYQEFQKSIKRFYLLLNILDHLPCEYNEERAEFSYPAIVAKGNDVFISYTWKRQTVAFWQIRMLE